MSISSSTQEPRDGIRFAMKTCFSRSFGSITYAPGERTSWVTTTRSVPLMMKVPQSVIRGRSPMKTFCSRISPVSRLMNETSIVSGRRVDEVLLAALLDRVVRLDVVQRHAGLPAAQRVPAELHGERAGEVLDR